MGPFDHEHADAWATKLRDVESLNAGASDHILRAIDAVRDHSREDPGALRSHALLVLGPAGAGKTHLFARLRRKVGPRATFVLARPELGGDPTPRHVLTWAMDALLNRVPGREDRQLDLVVGSALARLEGHGIQWPTVFLDELRSAAPDERAARLSSIVDQLGELFPEADLSWLERLMAIPTLGTIERRAALVWLSGREPDEGQLARLGLTEKLPDASVLGALRTLAFVASYSTPLVVVFDQLENLVDEDDAHDRRLHAHARLVSELFDTVRGLVIVQMALDAEWQRRIRPKLGASERSRLEARVEVLSLPTAVERARLIEQWTAGSGAEPLPWPFTADEWAAWQAAPGLTPRALMIACRRASSRTSADAEPVLPGGDAAASSEDRAASLADRLEGLWTEQLGRSTRELAEIRERGHPLDGDRLRAGLYIALRHGGFPVEQGRARQSFELRVASAVDVWTLQQSHPRAVSAALDRVGANLAAHAAVVVREGARPFPPTWTKVNERVRELAMRPALTLLELGDAELTRLLALHDLTTAARSRDLAGPDGAPIDPAAVEAWVRERLAPAAWPIGAAISAAIAARGGGPRERAEVEPRDGGEAAAQRPAGDAPGEATPPPPPGRDGAAAPSSEAGAVGAARATDATAPRGAAARGPAARRPSTPPPPAKRRPSGPPPPPPKTGATPARRVARTAPPASTAVVASVLERLCLASLERLTAEVRLQEPDLTRADVRARLRALGGEVRWLGRAIVAWRPRP